MNGVREYARRAGASVTYLPLAPDLRLRAPVSALRRSPPGAGLFGFPAQSNFSGVLHPLELVQEAQALGFDVLLDLAGYAPAHAFSLRQHPADFVVLSFYKIFGYPTGLGALVARRSALARLGRPWFAGGTVTWASVGDLRHRPLPLHEGFEDGTPDFLAIAALDAGFDLLAEVGMARLEHHVGELTALLLRGLRRLRHANGARLTVLYGPSGTRDRGGTVAFNVLDPTGLPIPFERVEERANAAGVALRGGCFCNPGASEAAFGIERGSAAPCFDALDADFSHEGLRACLGDGRAVGALRASLGLANNAEDVRRAIEVVNSFAQEAWHPG
jgi:selenocysteine lyase/cysteine desulfurase